MPKNTPKTEFLAKVKKLVPKSHLRTIEKAYDFANNAHAGQTRDTGDPFITHPAGCALHLAEMGVDTTTIVAGLLHDSVEDSDVTLVDIENAFGNEVAFLVEGSTKLHYADTLSREEGQIQTLQRMFLAMAKDIRAVLVKLADRLHNMETLYAKKPDSQKRIALETLDVYAPIAHRLGIGDMRGRLEDLSFQYLYPTEYSWVEKYAYHNIEERIRLISELQNEVKKLMHASHIKIVRSDGRVKHKYSLYKKLLRYNKDIRQIYDLVALRLIVADIPSCYEAMGILHEHYRPIAGRIKDYIATPKPNGYQSLHTTVQVGKGQIVEFQIRTPEMHKEAEFGVAAHWSYEQRKILGLFGRKQNKKEVQRQLEWVSALSHWKERAKDSREYFESLKIDFFNDRIYVRTPRGDIFDLPEGSMPLDFAYRVHTDIGHAYAGAKINGNIVKMNYELKNNDTVEILISKSSAGPKPKWLEYVKTSNARDKIRSWLRRRNPEENTSIGREIAERHIRLLSNLTPAAFVAKFTVAEHQEFLKTLGYSDLMHALEALGDGSMTLERGYELLKRNAPELYAKIEQLTVRQQKKEGRVASTNSDQMKVMVAGDPSLFSTLAQCCNPRPTDSIVGYLTKKKGIMVHRTDCMNIVEQKDAEKFVPAQWRDTAIEEHPLWLVVQVKRQPGVVRDLTYEIANSGYGVTNITAQELNDTESEVRVKLLVRDLAGVQRLHRTLESLDYVVTVARE